MGEVREKLKVQRPRCPYCHDDIVPGGENHACHECLTWHHYECFNENGSCVTCGNTLIKHGNGGLFFEASGRPRRDDGCWVHDETLDPTTRADLNHLWGWDADKILEQCTCNKGIVDPKKLVYDCGACQDMGFFLQGDKERKQHCLWCSRGKEWLLSQTRECAGCKKSLNLGDRYVVHDDIVTCGDSACLRGVVSMKEHRDMQRADVGPKKEPSCKHNFDPMDNRCRYCRKDVMTHAQEMFGATVSPHWVREAMGRKARRSAPDFVEAKRKVEARRKELQDRARRKTNLGVAVLVVAFLLGILKVIVLGV